jgi:conjugative relaxase-like TrwC/TraI family protein
MAFMEIMGAKSVRYHAETVMGRTNDHPGRALEYYGSRGETPLVWGGSGAASLGLEGRVTEHQYASIYGEGGAKDPVTGERLVQTKRPGMEIVIAAHKSVAELGVVGRADDMHAIIDAEREATLGYLDRLTQLGGGRRGRGAVIAKTTGLIYAHSRHATSRAGDPSPHDHVLVANVTEMLDAKGGFKAPDTSLWRDHLHAATMVGRMAAARKATELGYGIEADPGPSGKLGHFRIAGVPKEVCELHSKRAIEIEAECRRTGNDSYRSRGVAAKSTRAHKRHTPIGDLMERWCEEISEAGYSLDEVRSRVEEAGRQRSRFPALGYDQGRQMIRDLLSAKGPLGQKKLFSRPDVIVALAPRLFGHEPKVLVQMTNAVLSDPESIPLARLPGAKGQMYTTASVLATEDAIAESLHHQISRTDGPRAAPAEEVRAVRATETALGHPLSSDQRQAVLNCCGSGRGAEILLGVAGAGKTTALRAVVEAFSGSGYRVIGTATSGQAARTLAEEAGIGFSRTLASITWRLDHEMLRLTGRDVVVLDEAAMTDDPALLRLLVAAEEARAKVLLVGDHLQLGPVGPGGAFEALLRRHRGAAQVLKENVRQKDPQERKTLASLRSGGVEAAVDWYLSHGRVRRSETHEDAIGRAVEAFSADYLSGKDTVLLAWRRANVAELNARAREVIEKAGRLHGPEVRAPGGRRYRAGDKVVLLAPLSDAGLVTSERARVASVDERQESLTLLTEDGRRVCLSREDISAEHLDHAYAMTVHRTQGATTEVSHLLQDGGGRELAYVAMSRAREASFVYLVSDDLGQAKEDLVREWSSSKRPRWVSDLGSPGLVVAPAVERQELSPERQYAIALAHLVAKREALLAVIPPNHSKRLGLLSEKIAEHEQDLVDLELGRGRFEKTEVGEAAKEVLRARESLGEAITGSDWHRSAASGARGPRRPRCGRPSWNGPRTESASWPLPRRRRPKPPSGPCAYEQPNSGPRSRRDSGGSGSTPTPFAGYFVSTIRSKSGASCSKSTCAGGSRRKRRSPAKRRRRVRAEGMTGIARSMPRPSISPVTISITVTALVGRTTSDTCRPYGRCRLFGFGRPAPRHNQVCRGAPGRCFVAIEPNLAQHIALPDSRPAGVVVGGFSVTHTPVENDASHTRRLNSQVDRNFDHV